MRKITLQRLRVWGSWEKSVDTIIPSSPGFDKPIIWIPLRICCSPLFFESPRAFIVAYNHRSVSLATLGEEAVRVPPATVHLPRAAGARRPYLYCFSCRYPFLSNNT